MITNLTKLKEAFIAKFGDEGLKIWECLDNKISYANYLLGYTNSPYELLDYDDFYDEEEWLLSDNYDEEWFLSDDYEEEDCDYSSMHQEEYPMEEMTHFMISTVEFGNDNDTLFGYAKLVGDTVEFMNVINYGDRTKPYSPDYHQDIMRTERNDLPRDSDIVGFYFEKVISIRNDKGNKVYQSFYKIIK